MDITAIGNNPRICLTGATGYVGGRLLGILQRDGYRVRCVARRPENLRSRLSETTEAVRGDLLDRASLVKAMCDLDVAFYLVHSMGSSGNFAEEERRCAENFANAARESGIRRIIYLGGLGADAPNPSDHLSSRRQVGDILRGSGVPVIEFRASIVIGSGSVSFEMVRALVERLPVMITPRWVSVAAQPIAINDLLEYLRHAITLPVDGHRVFEIGGADVVSYGELMREYARLRGLRRVMLPVPVLTPRLSSLWLGLVTPLYARVGRKLIDSLRNASVVADPSASEAFPIRPMGVRDAIAAAMRNEDRQVARNPLVRCAVILGQSADLGRRPFRHAPGGPTISTCIRLAGGSVYANSAHRRQHRLVFRQLDVARAGFHRPPGRRRWRAPGPSRSF